MPLWRSIGIGLAFALIGLGMLAGALGGGTAASGPYPNTPAMHEMVPSHQPPGVMIGVVPVP